MLTYYCHPCLHDSHSPNQHAAVLREAGVSHTVKKLLSSVSMHTNMAMLPVQDLTKDVFRIDAIPSQSLDTVREWLSSMDIKFYENKLNLNWKQVLKSIVDVRLPGICHCCLCGTQYWAACAVYLLL